jgi:response regulator NasT
VGEQAVSNLSGRRVAVVEDEGITQLQLCRILRSEGLEVVGTATNGKDAVALVLSTRPDLVLMDIQMPLMDGLEASERILASYPVCIVMLTAFSDPDCVDRAKRIGTCGYVLKPFTVETLVPQLKAAFQKFQNASRVSDAESAVSEEWNSH